MAIFFMMTASTAAQQQQAARRKASAATPAHRDLPWPPKDELVAVTVERRVDGLAGFALWTVLIDGQRADSLGIGEQVQFCVHPGRHAIETTAARASGQSTFEAVGGEIVELRCRAEKAGLRTIIAIDRRPDRGQIVGNGPDPTD